MNRLNDAYYQKPQSNIEQQNSYNESLTYDKNGNIITLDRYGNYDTGLFAYQIDDLDYRYADKSNLLVKVTDAANAYIGFIDDSDGTVNGEDDYKYDANGNMVKDNNKGISKIIYNHLNLPTQIEFSGSGTIFYFYNAAGVKLKKEVHAVLQTNEITTTDYLGGFQYENTVLQFFPHPEGYVKNTPDKHGNPTYDYIYNYTDHLGNIRLSYTLDPVTNVLKILEENHYYPFGLKHTNYSSDRRSYIPETDLNPKLILPVVEDSYKYKYNGKEWQDELGLNFYDYGARNYDPAIGRWMNIDPLAEVSRRWSPYTYCYNNPIVFVDPDGMLAGVGDFISESGKKLGSDGISDGKVYVVKTTETKFDSKVNSAGISKEVRNKTEDFIKNNSGKTEAFKENSIAYDNSVEIAGKPETRQAMVDIVDQDKGTGGKSSSNNREYGGLVKEDGSVTQFPAGPIADPLINSEAGIDMFNRPSESTFHSHPSGTNSDANNTGNSASSSIGVSRTLAKFNQAPSQGDIDNSIGTVNYVFARGGKTVYIYNNSGVIATIPQKNFVTPKK